MTSAIEGPPNVYDFGLSFNYATWTPGTRVDLLNVSWNNDYRDVVRFADRAALKTFLDDIATAGHVVDNVSYLKFGEPISLDVPFNVAIQYNYLRASNPTQPIAGDVQRDYFYFITNVEYVAPNTTRFTLQLDIFQTYIYDVTFGNCYIERGHIGIANENAFDNYGRDYLTIPEGLDIGSEYQIVDAVSKLIMSTYSHDFDTSPETDTETIVNILVVSAVDLTASSGTVSAPVLVTASGSNTQNVPSGASLYVWDNPQDFLYFMNATKGEPWVTQGILSITVIPPLNRYVIPPVTFPVNTGVGSAPLYGGIEISNKIFQAIKQYSMLTNWRESAKVASYIPARYAGLKKFLTSPYMMIELTTFGGTGVMLKPESWNDPDATVIERAAIIPPNQRVAVMPFKYNTRSDLPVHGVGSPSANEDYGEFFDVATLVQNFPTLAIVNNMAIAYLAANKNSIAFQYESAGWSQQRALGSNQTAYDQASAGMNLANELTGVGIGADTSQTAQNNYTAGQQTINSQLGGAGNAIIGAIGSAPNPLGMAGSIGGGALGAALAQANLGVQQNQNTQSLAIRNAAANAANNASVGNQGFIRDTNKNLADWAAKGDYANNIAAINAKVQDAKLIQPSVSGQTGGETFNLVNDKVIVSFRLKMIDLANIRAVGEYWLRYGYSVRKFGTIPDDLMVMEKFTYWKLLETYISQAAMPEAFKQIIRGIFEKGVTVWRNPTDIGNIDIGDNAPLTGVTL